MPIPVSIRFHVGVLPCRHPVLPWALPLVLSLVVACGSDNVTPTPIAEPDELFWELELNHHAVTLSTTAPYDTLTLIATPRNYRDEPLTGLPAPTYTSSNPDIVAVSSDGVLVGIKPTLGTTFVKIAATVISANVKHVDTVGVRVVNNPTPPVLASFSIQPVPPDSGKTAAVGTRAINGFGFEFLLADFEIGDIFRRVPIRATDTAGRSIASDLLVWCRVADLTVAQLVGHLNIGCGRIIGHRPGMTKIYASTTAFGVSKADTLLYQIGWPLLETVIVGSGPQGEGNIFGQPEIRIGSGGLVYWTGGMGWYDGSLDGDDPSLLGRFGLPTTTTPTPVVFDDPTNVLSYNPSNVLRPAGFERLCGVGKANCDMSGDFVLDSAGYALRRFSVPGTYVYRNPLNNASGQIIVAD